MILTELVPWILAISALIGSIVAFRRWRSEGVFVKPSVILDLQKRADLLQANADNLSEKLDKEIRSRRRLQKKSEEDSNRIRSLEQNEQMNHKHLMELTEKLDEWQKGIDILINQIENRHNSRPDWRPE